MKKQIKEEDFVTTKCRGETWDEAEKRNQHFINLGRKQALEKVEKVIDDLNDKFRKENTYVLLDGDEFNDLWAMELKQKLLGGEDDK